MKRVERQRRGTFICPRARVVLAAALFIATSLVSPAQIFSFSTRPSQWTNAIVTHNVIGRLGPSNIGGDTIFDELADSNIIHLLAKSAGISDSKLASIEVVPDASGDRFAVAQAGKPDKTLEIMNERVKSYVWARLEGHTKEYLFTALTNKVAPLSIKDVDLRVLFLNQPFIVPWRAVRMDSGTQTNKPDQTPKFRTTMAKGELHIIPLTNKPASDEVRRWATYRITDGEISWLYVLNFRANGRLEWIYADRRDAKEDDPKFQSTIKSVEAEVAAEMKARGTFEKFGAIHEFWDLKKKKLQAQGIDWRSPAELNPDTHYD